MIEDIICEIIRIYESQIKTTGALCSSKLASGIIITDLEAAKSFSIALNLRQLWCFRF